jgi:hypothetical protein
MEKVGKEGVITVSDGKTLDNGQHPSRLNALNEPH